MTGMLLYDRVHGTRKGLDRLENFNRILEQEFTMAEGRTGIITARRVGFLLATGGPGSFTSNVQLMNMTSPRQAQAYWALFHHLLKEKFRGDLSGWQPEGAGAVDAGNYRKNGVFMWASLMKSAREMGDEEMYRFALDRYDATGAEVRNGVLHGKGSNFAQLSAHSASFATADTWYRMAHGDVPAAISTGPVLAAAPYPDVMVAWADNDGGALDLELCSGVQPGVRELKLARLAPGAFYRVESSEAGADPVRVTAAGDGTATLVAAIGRRTRIRIIPCT